MNQVDRQARPTRELQEIICALAESPRGFSALATLVHVEGSSYRRPGARLLVYSDGRRIGSISGGCLEEDVITRSRRVIETGTAEMIVYDTTSENDLVWGVGLGCHGIVRVLVERLSGNPDWAVRLSENFAAREQTTLAVIHAADDVRQLGTGLSDAQTGSSTERFVQTIRPPTRLCVFGAGDDAKPLVRLGNELGWRVVVADPRPAFATSERFPNADSVLTGPCDQLVQQLRFDPDSVAVIMTHHYVHDRPLARALLSQPLAYLGLLGPRQRADKILADLAAEAFTVTAAQRARLHAPVGLDLGADGPEQVALAIAAEIQAVLGNRDGQPLRERRRPIHG